MELIILYAYTIVATSVIGLTHSEKYKIQVKVPQWIRIFLILWTSKEKIPLYLLLSRIVVQVISIVCFFLAYISSPEVYKQIQITYGEIMIGAVLPITALRSLLKH